jgi:ABC-type glycerol-3-phosphate transport system substrate-binding protein
MARVACLVLLVPVLALAACGGGNDAADAKQAVRDFVTATNARDGDKLCGHLLTQDYMEKATGATGDAAQKACKQQLQLLTGLKIRLVSIGKTSVDGDKATVRAVILASGQRSSRVFTLAKEDGAWKLEAGEETAR